jgi:protein-S-isoprenylcysteine O-methyltransferase Ste14
MIFAVSFPLYVLDQQNSVATLAGWIAFKSKTDADLVARVLFLLAAILMIVAALIRTWASAYLHAGVVYAANVKTDSLVADGPYRHVRNPLYFANLLMALALGSMMSRVGFVVAVVAILAFCYRLILREESELQAHQGAEYLNYRKAVPRFWPSLWPAVTSAGRASRWADGFKAESWYWGFAAAILAFAISLKIVVFFVILGASIILFWVSSVALQRKSKTQG